MGVKASAKKAAFDRGLLLGKPASSEQLSNFVSRFLDNYVAVDLVRIGGCGDGGYLVPNDLEGIRYCFSPGVDYTASFESELANEYDVKCFMADASVSEPPSQNPAFDFEAKYIGPRNIGEFMTLSSWVTKKACNDDEMLLQMDIEGAEYDVFIETDIDILKKFRSMIVEFHGLDRLFDRNYISVMTAIFEKIYKGFSIAHVHPNNCCGVVSLGGIDVPKVVEITFIRNDRVQACSSNLPIILPHQLDEQNVDSKPDIKMPREWWGK
ncbi:FkbM family methyltransferase [Pseudovibrio sp. Tun.PSC04-5.I4]|uniref:FkbM family methyltransferase n=1 Tax=Pseudovibrio sp. Tun.PSC04-5.I4 TaxID=1798213 RepID=UPI000890098E|nr:FkbM family methyltransferase [Pseudovibrio sp. Tun.PSC04-5.I4]SDQ94595.1 Methyltransferase FkbM domain-containing protein [Pseudovibrio sp. Tun.PSC04-5.I4]